MKRHLTNWTYLDFKNNEVFLRRSINIDTWNCIPATQEHHKVFIDRFVKNGVEKCTFKDFKEFVSFDGRSKYRYNYGVVRIDQSIFYDLIRWVDNPDEDELSEGLKKMIHDYIEVKSLLKDMKDSSGNGLQNDLSKIFRHIATALESKNKTDLLI